jgi:HD-GYP domain-containing protein (c-di-GMP phosphodiesterase class II)
LVEEKISMHDFVESFVKGLETRDVYTSGHSIRVAHLGCLIGEKLKLDERIINNIHIAGHLHDIGKIGISDEVLNKKGKLTKSEYEILKSHSEKGYDIVRNIPQLERISKIILYHHEWYNGEGYPRQIRGKDIPIESRIISVCDAFDAMTSDRSYRKALPLEIAMEELINGKGSQFDPSITEVFLEILRNEYTLVNEIMISKDSVA